MKRLALQELNEDGAIGPALAELIYETVDAVRRFGHYPPPTGSGTWDADAVIATAHDFITDAAHQARFTKLASSASDQESFERLLGAAVRNFLRDQARRTERGRTLRAIRRHLDEAGYVSADVVGSSWARADHVRNPVFSGSVADLIAAAYRVPVRRARWSQDSTRRPPLAEADSFDDLLEAIFEAARAPVLSETLLEVILARLPFADAPRFQVLDDREPSHSDLPGARLVAIEIWDQLTDIERVMVAYLDRSVREVASDTGLSRSAAHRAMASTRDVLARCLGEVTEQIPVIAELRNLSLLTRRLGEKTAGIATER